MSLPPYLIFVIFYTCTLGLSLNMQFKNFVFSPHFFSCHLPPSFVRNSSVYMVLWGPRPLRYFVSQVTAMSQKSPSWHLTSWQGSSSFRWQKITWKWFKGSIYDICRLCLWCLKIVNTRSLTNPTPDWVWGWAYTGSIILFYYSNCFIVAVVQPMQL